MGIFSGALGERLGYRAIVLRDDEWLALSSADFIANFVRLGFQGKRTASRIIVSDKMIRRCWDEWSVVHNDQLADGLNQIGATGSSIKIRTIKELNFMGFRLLNINHCDPSSFEVVGVALDLLSAEPFVEPN